ncbi:hypothetical protein Y032_0252g206 [Ancylostoma ceylanicum]|nr:hypothetical protein Y032_0252g206 [Ancylostoma ceylanicum]
MKCMVEDLVKQGFKPGRFHSDVPAWPLALPFENPRYSVAFCHQCICSYAKFLGVGTKENVRSGVLALRNLALVGTQSYELVGNALLTEEKTQYNRKNAYNALICTETHRKAGKT